MCKVHKPCGTICFLNVPLAKCAVPMSQNHANLPDTSKYSIKKFILNYESMAVLRGCAHWCQAINQTAYKAYHYLTRTNENADPRLFCIVWDIYVAETV